MKSFFLFILLILGASIAPKAKGLCGEKLVLVADSSEYTHGGSGPLPITDQLYSSLNTSFINLSNMIFGVLHNASFLLDMMMYINANGTYSGISVIQQLANGSVIGVLSVVPLEGDGQIISGATKVSFIAGEYIQFLFGADSYSYLKILPDSLIALQEICA